VSKILFPNGWLSISLNLLTISKFILELFLRKTALEKAMLAKRKIATNLFIFDIDIIY